MAMAMLQPTVGITLADSSASVATMQLNAWHGTTAAAGLSAVGQLRSVVQPATTCRVVAGRYTLSAKEQNPDSPSPGGRTWRAGLFVFATTDPDHYLILSLPGLRANLVMLTGPGAGVDIDIADPAVANFINAVLLGPWCSPFGFAPIELLSAVYEVRPA